MHFTQGQIYEVLEQVLSKEDGLEQILKMSLESLMKSERTIHNESNLDSSNGFRPRKTFGRGKILELRVPRTRFVVRDLSCGICNPALCYYKDL